MIIQETAEGGIDISFSRRDLDSMSREDFTMLKLMLADFSESFNVDKVSIRGRG